MKKFHFILLGIGVIILLSIVWYLQSSLNNKDTVRLRAADGREMTVKVEVADTQSEQERGLMYRSSLANDEGMLFVFNDEQTRNFWMKNTLIPLDILFFDRYGTFVSAQTMEPCKKDPCASYSSGDPAMYALEVSKGFLSTNGSGPWSLLLLQGI